MFYTERLTSALLERFEDMDEVRDICSYGCKDGVPGFTSYQEKREFFDDFEDDIEDVCYDILGIDYLEQLSRGETCVLGLISNLVCFTVEAYCHHRKKQHESLAAV